MNNKKYWREYLTIVTIALILLISCFLTMILSNIPSEFFWLKSVIISIPIPMLIIAVFLAYHRINLFQFWPVKILIPIGIFLMILGVILQYLYAFTSLKGFFLIIAGSFCFLITSLLGTITLLTKTQNSIEKNQKTEEKDV